MFADHSPHELLGSWSFAWPALLAVLAVIIAVVGLGDVAWPLVNRVGVGVVIGVASVVPATLAGYCSRSRLVVATLIFSTPAVGAAATRFRNRNAVAPAIWIAAGAAIAVYAAALRSSCWEDSYKFDDGLYYGITLGAPAALIAGVMIGRLREWDPPAIPFAARIAARRRSATSAIEPPATVPNERMMEITRDSVIVKRLLLAPIAVGIVLLPTVLLTIIGVVLLALSAGIWIAATRAISTRSTWHRVGIALLVFSMILAMTGCTGMLLWAAQQAFSFSSPWSSIAISLCLCWSAAFVAIGTRILLQSRPPS